MKNILKAEFKKLLSAKFVYVLVALALLLPLLSAGFLKIIGDIVSDSGEPDILASVFSAQFVYAGSFSLTQNVGLLVLITIIVLGANDFSQNTIRGKLIAGYDRKTVFLSSLVYNLVIMFIIIFIYTSATFAFTALFQGLQDGDFIHSLGFAAIAFSSYFMLYTLTTVLTYTFKNIIGPLALSLGSVFFIFMLYTLLGFIPDSVVDFSFLIHVLPFIRVMEPALQLDLTSFSMQLDTKLWWLSALVNIGHVAWLTLLGIHVAKKTDYK